jgi:hypothetical protein
LDVPVPAAVSGNQLSSRVTSTTWQRIALLPGLELLIDAAASPAVRRAAQSICAEYVGGRDEMLPTMNG